MRQAKVLIVDDSVVMRQLIRQALGTDPSICVQGVAANGRIALAMIGQGVPDAVLLDIEMPEMNGLSCLREIRKHHSRLPVIMCSTLTEHGAAITLEALALGATDYVTKPSSLGTVSDPVQQLAGALLPKLRSLCGLDEPITIARSIGIVRPAVQRQWPIRLVVIGCSTGGPNALADMLPELTAHLPVPVLIVQHMPPVFTRLMAERLDKCCALRVREAVEGAKLQAGDIWIAPGDHHLTIVPVRDGHALHLSQGPPENSCRPAVDVLFRAAAKTHGAGVLAVVLTGMGYDGLQGVESIRQASGRVLAQDQNSSVVWGMPGAIVQSGLADEVLALPKIGQRIEQIVTASCGLAAVAR